MMDVLSLFLCGDEKREVRHSPVVDIPVKAKGDLAVAYGAIYYGALTRDRVYVRTTENEFDFPQAQANAEAVYNGTGGIALSSFWRKLVVANEGDGLRLFISGYFTPERSGSSLEGSHEHPLPHTRAGQTVAGDQ